MQPLKPKSYKLKANDGFIALVAVLIILAIVLMVGVALSLGSVDEMKMGLQKSLSSRAYYLANLCAEQALMKLKENSSYPGNETINEENGSCTISAIEGSWTVKVSGFSSGQVKKMKIVLSQINPEIIINSWQEVADF